MTEDQPHTQVRRMTIPLSGVSSDGSAYGTITKSMREEVDFDDLYERSDRIRGTITISFEEVVDDS